MNKKVDQEIAGFLADKLLDIAIKEAPVELAQVTRVFNEIMENDKSGVAAMVLQCFIMKTANRVAAMMLHSIKLVETVSKTCPDSSKGLISSVVAPGLLSSLAAVIRNEFSDDREVFTRGFEETPEVMEEICKALKESDTEAFDAVVYQVKELFKRNSETNFN